jgi:hypothetical protein
VSCTEDDYYDASFGVHKCRRYHAKLRDFYQAAYNYTVAANAFAASGAFIAVLGSLPILAGILSGTVALASLLESIFRYEQKARYHQDLCRRFTEPAAEIELMPATAENLARVRARRLEIEADETAEKRLIEILAANEEGRARGVPEAKLQPLSWCQCHFGYFKTFGMRRLEQRKAKMEADAAVQAGAVIPTP